MTRRKGYLTRRELEIVDRFQSGESISRIACDHALGFVGNALRKALTHQRVTDHGYVYYDKPRRKP